MKKIILLLLSVCLATTVIARKKVDDAIKSVLAKKLTGEENPLIKKNKRKHENQKKEEKTIHFNYTSENLIDIVNTLATQKGVNVILPQGANAITTKVTLNLSDPLSIDEAWKMLYTVLTVSGYSLLKRDDMYVITKVDTEINKEPLPLYISTKPEDLPEGDKRIRYLYYMDNIKVADSPDSEVMKILQELLPKETSSFKIDVQTNGLIINANANEIKSVMTIIQTIDTPSFNERIKIISLRHTSAKIIADLFNEKILKAVGDISRYRLGSKKPKEKFYFDKRTKIIPELRTNKLIILGRAQAVGRVKKFIQDYMDVELGSGRSILHIYQLQYLEAEKLEPVLMKAIESARGTGTGQSRATRGKASGTQRMFNEVIIKADKPTGGEGNYFGGNKLIIACRNDDWTVIKKLIEELDTPQPQVLIEVLIADLTIEDIRLLGSLTRKPAKIPGYNKTEIQSAQMAGVILDSNDNPSTLAADLLRKAFNNDGSSGGTDASVAKLLSAGSTVISLNDDDGKTWSILQLLQTFRHSKILSHPHVIATNNQQASVKIGETRLLRDEAVGSTGTTTIRTKQQPAELLVKIIPRISSANTVNLDVKINIDEYTSDVIDSRITRKIETNANVKTGDILALGGLIRVDTSNEIEATPLLSRIPVLGYFFKKRRGRANKTNLTIFISPTVIEPRLRGGIGKYTKDYIGIAKRYAKEGELFDGLKEPITRLFFKRGEDTESSINDFLAKDEFITTLPLDPNKIPTNNKRPQRKKGQAFKAASKKKNLPFKKKTILAKTEQQDSHKKTANKKELKMILSSEKNPFLSS